MNHDKTPGLSVGRLCRGHSCPARRALQTANEETSLHRICRFCHVCMSDGNP